MSKINKIRLVNLNYNYNTMKIEDEIFDLYGENTMFNLRNGGGKSVLVQMIMAPFVNKRYRSTKDRTFDSYFTTSTPTYILIEWKLDQEAGFLLTGMMVRKKEATSDENSKDKLDIINFIHEYRENNEYDINNIPIVEEKNNRRSIKSFANSKKLLEDLKKNRNLKFNYYDMNNSVTTSNYFAKLREYDINNKEWEDIIKKINLKESGLSELFTKAKDSSGLVKEWFLPAIENKLKNDEDRIKNYGDLLNSYIKQYRQNKSNIDKKAKLELFNELSSNLLKCCDEFISNIEKKETIKNEIANAIYNLRENLDNTEKEEGKLEDTIITLLDEIKDIRYEEESIKIHKKQEEVKLLEIESKDYEEKLIDSEKRLNNFKRQRDIFDCAKIHRDYMEKSRELQEEEHNLQALNKKNEDNGPHINNLGFTIKGILQKELEIIKNENTNKKNLQDNLLKEKDVINNELNDYRIEDRKLRENKGRFEAEINSFDIVEETFNKSYNLDLFRNIEGFFNEDKLLTISKDIKEEGYNLTKERKNNSEKIVNLEENLKSVESEKAKNTERTYEVNNNLNNNKLEYEKYKEEIEKRKEIIKYIDLEEDKVFNNDLIISTYNRKINLLKLDLSKLNKIFDNKNNEIIKLKTGKVLELPKDIEDKLKVKDITITYGMEWLKINGYSLERNEEIVKNNPFIPYSLIMDSKEMAILEKECLDIFTSTPISIINRVDLEKSIENINSDIANLNGISFYISFNNKLLNEKELLKLIENKQIELDNIKNNISEQEEYIKVYESKKNYIEFSNITLERYEDLQNEIKSLEEEIIKLREIEIDLDNKRLTNKDEITALKNKDKILSENIKNIEFKEKAFINIESTYENYKKSKNSLEITIETLKVLQSKTDNLEDRKVNIEKEVQDLISAINSYNIKEDEISKEISTYNPYKSGIIIERDKEDLLAEYSSLTKDIASSEKELLLKIDKLNIKFRKVEEELDSKANKYQVHEDEYTNVIYDINKEFEIGDSIKKEDNNHTKLKDENNHINNLLNNGIEKLEELYKKLKDDFNKLEPKEKNLLVEKDFKLEADKIKFEIKNNEEKKKEIIKIKGKIENNLSSLNEFNDLEIIEKLEIKLDLTDLDNYIGKLKRDLNNSKTDENEKEKNLTNSLVDIEIKEEFKQDSLFKEPIQTLKLLIVKPREFKEHLNLIINSYEMLMEKLIADIEMIQKEEGKILESILEYIKDVHENIKKIDENSSITIGNKRLKMLNINVTDWEDNKEICKIRLREYIEQIRDKGLKALENNDSIEEIVSNNININKLYDEVCGIGNVSIKLYKIEEDKQRQISWNEVSKNSGGEGFLSAFVILSSLLSYMRKEDSEIFSRKESGKVLIMDNPFAQTNSAHLLKPLMDIAKRSNTQLICLTGLSGDAIYNRFDNIYVLNLISSKLNNNIKYIKSEHQKGEEEKQVIVATNLKIEEQIKLF